SGLQHSRLPQAGLECCDLPAQRSACPGAEEPDRGNRWLLRARGVRPRVLIRCSAEEWDKLSDLLDEQGRSQAAIDCLRRALQAGPDYADAMFNLALLLQRANQPKEAAEYSRRYLANDAQSEWAARARRFAKCKFICQRAEKLWKCLSLRSLAANHCKTLA